MGANDHINKKKIGTEVCLLIICENIDVDFWGTCKTLYTLPLVVENRDSKDSSSSDINSLWNLCIIGV